MKPARFLRIPAVFILFFIAACGSGQAAGATPAVEIFPTEEFPGVGETAEKGYAASEPVIAALEKFKADHGAYPDKLAELVPDYLDAVPAATGELDFSYAKEGDTYYFSFHYRGPGLNTCTYTPGKDWGCSGAF